MIQLIDVYKSFEKKAILKGVSLRIEEGERAAVIGPSGCGKSTILKMISGLLQPDAGKVLIRGQNIWAVDEETRHNLLDEIGMLFQYAALFDSLTVEENVGFALHEQPKDIHPVMLAKKVKEKLALVEMSGKETMYPSELSGGQKKRIGLARALLKDPKVMLYDEPTTGLDPILSTNIENLIVKLSEDLNMTSIIVTHQISTILRTADKIYLMEDGRLHPPESPSVIHTNPEGRLALFIKGGL